MLNTPGNSIQDIKYLEIVMYLLSECGTAAMSLRIGHVGHCCIIQAKCHVPYVCALFCLLSSLVKGDPYVDLYFCCRRQDNLQGRADTKKANRIEKREKKLMRAGFEGRRSSFINS